VKAKAIKYTAFTAFKPLRSDENAHTQTGCCYMFILIRFHFVSFPPPCIYTLMLNFKFSFAAVCNTDFRGKTFLLMFLQNAGGSSTNPEIIITNPGTFSSLVRYSVFAPNDATLRETNKLLKEHHVSKTGIQL